jgi:DNA-binding protein H-NS
MYQISGVADAQIPRSKKADKLSAAFQKEASPFIESVKAQKRKIKKYFDQVTKEDTRKYVKNKKRELKRCNCYDHRKPSKAFGVF